MRGPLSPPPKGKANLHPPWGREGGGLGVDLSSDRGLPTNVVNADSHQSGPFNLTVGLRPVNSGPVNEILCYWWVKEVKERVQLMGCRVEPTKRPDNKWAIR